MNPLIITIMIALATFVISIFGASWLNQQAMNKRADEINRRIDVCAATWTHALPPSSRR